MGAILPCLEGGYGDLHHMASSVVVDREWIRFEGEHFPIQIGVKIRVGIAINVYIS
jgi:hypothetical protein